MIAVDTKDTDWDLLASEVQATNTSSGIEVGVLTNSKSKRAIHRYLLATISTAYEKALSLIAADNIRGSLFSVQTIDGWLSLIREKLYSHPAVEDIFVSIEDSDVDVWVVIPRRDISILRQLVEIEGQILEMLVSGERAPFLIDFHVIYRCGRNIEELVSNRAIRLPRQV